MSAWDDLLRSERDRFVDDLVRAGFRPDANNAYTLTNEVEIPALNKVVEIRVTIPDSFPFVPPRVKPTAGDGTSSWHRERDNTLCLWAAESEPSQPWTSVEFLVARVCDWFLQDQNGWINDSPNLDLERYWMPLGENVLFLHDGLTDSHGFCFDVHPARVSKGTASIYRVQRRWQPTMRRKRGHEKALVINIGELSTPPREFDHLLDRVAEQNGQTSADEVDRIVRGSVDWLLVRYERNGNPGVLALAVVNRKPLLLNCVEAAEDSDRVRNLRRGTRTDQLAVCKVAIVGVGAVGSFLADQLTRSGIPHLTLIDHDLLRPGNLPRHLAGSKHIGQPKVHAVADQLREDGLLDITTLETRESRLDPCAAELLLTEHDLVIDATANATITRALAAAAQLTGRSFLSICVQHDGATTRLDRYPISPSEQHSPPTEAPPGGLHPPGYEGGCGDPISPTPPYSCISAASLASSAAASILTGLQIPPTIVQHVLV